jgi:hypothetical protein
MSQRLSELLKDQLQAADMHLLIWRLIALEAP